MSNLEDLDVIGFDPLPTLEVEDLRHATISLNQIGRRQSCFEWGCQPPQSRFSESGRVSVYFPETCYPLLQIPVLQIFSSCQALQVANAAFSADLVPDLEWGNLEWPALGYLGHVAIRRPLDFSP